MFIKINKIKQKIYNKLSHVGSNYICLVYITIFIITISIWYFNLTKVFCTRCHPKITITIFIKIIIVI